ncbi:MAG: adenylosuccinate lyase [Acidimicrobiia bacterium]
MIERYSLPEMSAVWSQDRMLALWQEIEALVLEGWAAEGVVPSEAADAVRAATVDPAVWQAREAETHHDVAAFVDVLAAAAGEHGRWVHFGLTSSDLLDTSLGVRLMEAGGMLQEGVIRLFETVQRLAVEHRDTVMVGRTHGMWAEPTTFGHKLAGFGFALVNSHHRLLQATHTVSYGKVSGPVGNHSTVPPTVERHVTEALGLHAEPAATQVVSRDRHAMFMSTLAVVGAVLERFAIEIRHLQRSEVAEVAEPFVEGQKGSSAMPHKHNPILSENVTGMARLLRGYAVASLENVALWHERDISHSSVERVAVPDACLVLDFALARMNRILTGLAVHADRMRANLEASNGTVFSQSILLALVSHGMERDAAYRIVQSASTEALDTGTHVGEVLAADNECPLDDDALDATFDLDHYLTHAGKGVDHLATITPQWMRGR